MKFIKEGKDLTRQRLKVLRYADRDGWSAALHFVDDDIADDEKEEKRMKKSKKEAERAKESREGKRRATNTQTRAGPSYTTQFKPSGQTASKRGRYEEPFDNRGCYICGEYGHVAKFCRRRFSYQRKDRY